MRSIRWSLNMVLQTKQWVRIREDKGRLPEEPLRAQNTKASVVVAGETSFSSIAWSLSRTRVYLMGASVNGRVIYRHFCKPSRPTDQIYLKTIFNRVTECKPFVVEHVEMVEHESQSLIEITMRTPGNGEPMCSGCGERCSGYGTLPTARRTVFISL